MGCTKPCWPGMLATTAHAEAQLVAGHCSSACLSDRGAVWHGRHGDRSTRVVAGRYSTATPRGTPGRLHARWVAGAGWPWPSPECKGRTGLDHAGPHQSHHGHSEVEE